MEGDHREDYHVLMYSTQNLPHMLRSLVSITKASPQSTHLDTTPTSVSTSVSRPSSERHFASLNKLCVFHSDLTSRIETPQMRTMTVSWFHFFVIFQPLLKLSMLSDFQRGKLVLILSYSVHYRWAIFLQYFSRSKKITEEIIEQLNTHSWSNTYTAFLPIWKPINILGG
jgi:hypothetical protein